MQLFIVVGEASKVTEETWTAPTEALYKSWVRQWNSKTNTTLKLKVIRVLSSPYPSLGAHGGRGTWPLGVTPWIKEGITSAGPWNSCWQPAKSLPIFLGLWQTGILIPKDGLEGCKTSWKQAAGTSAAISRGATEQWQEKKCKLLSEPIARKAREKASQQQRPGTMAMCESGGGLKWSSLFSLSALKQNDQRIQEICSGNSDWSFENTECEDCFAHIVCLCKQLLLLLWKFRKHNHQNYQKLNL